jgi:hypothetical protein
METTVIREEVQAFLQASQSFLIFKQCTPLTSSERKAIATIVPMLGSDSKPPTDDPPLATTLSNLPLID